MILEILSVLVIRCSARMSPSSIINSYDKALKEKIYKDKGMLPGLKYENRTSRSRFTPRPRITKKPSNVYTKYESSKFFARECFPCDNCTPMERAMCTKFLGEEPKLKCHYSNKSERKNLDGQVKINLPKVLFDPKEIYNMYMPIRTVKQIYVVRKTPILPFHPPVNFSDD